MLQIGVITKNTFGLEVAVMSQPKRNDDCIFAVQNCNTIHMFFWLSFSLLLSLSFTILDKPQNKGVIRYNTHTYTQPWELNLQQKFSIPPHRIGVKTLKTENLV